LKLKVFPSKSVNNKVGIKLSGIFLTFISIAELKFGVCFTEDQLFLLREVFLINNYAFKNSYEKNPKY